MIRTDSSRRTTGVSLDRLNAYLRQMLTTGDGPKTYGAKLLAFPAGSSTINQVNDVIIRSLTESFDSRRAVATTMNQPDEWNITDPPCLIAIQCLQADGRLNMIAVFRSHDIFRAGLHNAIAVRKLQKHIADEVCLDLGALMVVSNSAHIYEANWGAAQKLIDCAFLKRKPRAGLKPEQYDPRGNYLIRLNEGKIMATLRSQDGAILIDLEDERASRIMDRVAQLGLTVDPRHLMYLGAALTKAEIALRAKGSYLQDRD
jgi:thymidylate synthase